MSKATQCAEELNRYYDITRCFETRAAGTEEIAEVIRRFYPEEETTVTHCQNPAPTNSLRMIDEGRDV